jgi:hypothetical protein
LYQYADWKKYIFIKLLFYVARVQQQKDIFSSLIPIPIPIPIPILIPPALNNNIGLFFVPAIKPSVL